MEKYCIWENVRGGKLLQFLWYSLNHECFPVNHGLVSICNISLQNWYSEIFTVNSYFPLKMQKFSSVDVFPYMVYEGVVKRFPIEIPYCIKLRLVSYKRQVSISALGIAHYNTIKHIV